MEQDMDRISVFDYVEKACNVLDENANGFARAADKLTEYLQSTFGCIDSTIGITSRIKTRDSLKEKLLRNHLYKDYPAERVVYEMHDIIGVRLECRFFKDEKNLYDEILRVFDTDAEDGYKTPSGKKAIRLKLDTPQPEKQKNGFDIYRIDGSITYAGESYNFELQIKSLVNSFWSEIEHKLIYKNVRFSPTDSLMQELLNSIHESLSGVDHQLNLIFDRFTSNSLDKQNAQLESMLALGITDIYTAIIRRELGISVSISEYAEAIVIYILTASSFRHSAIGEPFANIMRNALGAPEPERKDRRYDTYYGSMLITLMEWMRNIDYSAISIGKNIELREPLPETVDPEVARVFLNSINTDFHLNTFFHIFFSLERGTDDEDFADYIRYYSDRIFGNKTQTERHRTLAALIDTPAHKLPLEDTIKELEKIV